MRKKTDTFAMHLFQNRYLLERKSHVLMLFCPTFHNISVYRSNSFTHLSQMIFESFLLLLLMFSLRVILTKNRGTFLLMVSMRLGRQKCQEKVGQSATFSVGSGHTKKWAIKCVNFQPSSRVLWKLFGWSCSTFGNRDEPKCQWHLHGYIEHFWIVVACDEIGVLLDTMGESGNAFATGK